MARGDHGRRQRVLGAHQGALTRCEDLGVVGAGEEMAVAIGRHRQRAVPHAYLHRLEGETEAVPARGLRLLTGNLPIMYLCRTFGTPVEPQLRVQLASLANNP